MKADTPFVEIDSVHQAATAAPCRSVQEGIAVNWGFIVPVGTILFFAALHQWPPDGRRWERDDVEEPARGADPATLADAQPPRDPVAK